MHYNLTDTRYIFALIYAQFPKISTKRLEPYKAISTESFSMLVYQEP